jgi:signal peptidase I
VRSIRRQYRSGSRWLPVALVAALLPGCGAATNGIERYEKVSDSMEPAIQAGEKVTARRVEPGRYEPRRGDIVVFNPPDTWKSERHLIARLIAIGPETISCCDTSGHVTVDGQALDEPYVVHNSPLDPPPDRTQCRSRRFGPVELATGQLFVMGDHRNTAVDSRCRSPITARDVVAVVQRETAGPFLIVVDDCRSPAPLLRLTSLALGRYSSPSTATATAAA